MGTETFTQPPEGFGYVPLRKCESTQVVTLASPSESLSTLAEHAAPVGLTRTETWSLPASALSFESACS